MCVLVRASSTISPEAPVYDRDDVSVLVSDRLTDEQVRFQVRTLLDYLGAPQCHSDTTCWCGEPVELPRGSLVTAMAARERHM